MERYSTDGQSVPSLFGVSLRDAFADLLRDHYGHGRRKKAARALKLTDDAARRLCEGRPSVNTVEEALAGRPDLYVEIGIRKYGDAFRQAFREQLAKEQTAHADTSAAITALGRRLHLVRDGGAAVDHGVAEQSVRSRDGEGSDGAGGHSRSAGPAKVAGSKRGGAK